MSQHRARPAPPATESDRVPSWLASAAAWSWRVLLLLVAAAVVVMVLTRLYLVTLPVFVALILTTLLAPPARAMQRRGVPRMLAALISTIGGLALVSGLIAALIPVFASEVGQLVETFQAGVGEAYGFIESTFGWDQQAIADLVNQGLSLLQERSGQVAQQALTGAAIVAEVLTALLLTLVLTFFFVKDGEQIVGWIQDRTAAPYRDTMRAVGQRGWTALAGFVRGTAAIALVDAIGIGIGLAILGIPAVVPLAVLVFLGAFIPVIGAFVTGLLAVLVALASGGFQAALIALAIVIGVQQLESNILQPAIMRRTVALHPVVILGGLTAGAALLGIVGAFLAVPVTASLAAIGNELRLRHETDTVVSRPVPSADADLQQPLGGPSGWVRDHDLDELRADGEEGPDERDGGEPTGRGAATEERPER